MPLLTPSQIHVALKEENKSLAKANPDKLIDLRSLLEKNNLTADECLDNLSSQMRSAETGATRLQAVKVALELNGLLKNEQATPDFHVTINILDSEFAGTNPILLPR